MLGCGGDRVLSSAMAVLPSVRDSLKSGDAKIERARSMSRGGGAPAKVLVAHEGKPCCPKIAEPIRPSAGDSTTSSKPLFKQGGCVKQASGHVACSEHVSTDSTRYQQIAHQCVRLLGN